MRPLRFAAALAAMILLHVLLTRLLPGAGEVVDLFLILIVLNAVSSSSLSGLLGGCAAGLAQDAFSGGAFGLYGFAGTIIGYLAARVAQRLVIEKALGVGAVVAAAVVLQQGLLLWVSFLALPDLIVLDPARALIRALISGVLTAGGFALTKRWRLGAESRRRQRVKRLKLE